VTGAQHDDVPVDAPHPVFGVPARSHAAPAASALAPAPASTAP